MILIILSLVLVLAITPAQSSIGNDCLKCICEASTGCKAKGCWDKENGVHVCGPYEITYPYWNDCGKLGYSFEQCATDPCCAKVCVMQYMKRYGNYCTQWRHTPTCDDYAMIHKEGPHGCRNKKDNMFLKAVQTCLSPSQ